MKKIPPITAAVLALVGALPAASAATQLGEYFSLSGFGTLGGVQTTTDEGKFGRDRQPGSANKQASLDVDSNLGVQMTGTATRWLSATVQVLASKSDKGHIEPKVEWAFVTVKPLEGLTVRGGRMAAPTFAISDSRNIGYANTWVRAPNEVYALNLFRNVDGADVTYRKSFGTVAVSATAFGGKGKFLSPAGTYADCKDVKGVNLLLETDWATFRIGQARTDVRLGTSPSDPYKFTGVGVTVDRDNLIAQAEFVQRRSQNLANVVNADGWYVMAGYRFGAVTPYAIVSNTEPKTPTSVALLSAKQKTTALGVRWDAFTAASLKLQVDRIDTSNTKGISFTTPQLTSTVPGPRGNLPISKPVTAFSVALDFAF